MLQVETPRAESGLQIAESLISDVSGLISPPDVCLRVAELVQCDTSSADDIGEVIIRDPNLTARLLRLVNSSFYGFRSKIDTVSRAVTVIGIRDLQSLVMAISAVKSFSNVPNKLVNMDTFWRHSIYTGLIARSLARRCSVLHPERLFIAGLLHDIGSLILYCRLHEIARDLLLVADGDEEVFYRAELETLGFSHADLGAMLLARWQIPENLQEAVRDHHDPASASKYGMEAAILHVANLLANRSGIGGFCETPKPVSGINAEALAALRTAGLELDEDAVIGEAGLQFADTMTVLAA